ncbi:uncharacterized protein LOC135498448 [Lineus longissimus]|uniref:uncharacterized protein LOC135498448 n=1 Tax=Lineus longissimus TaxID=88925 RepID=UPI002B4E92CF
MDLKYRDSQRSPGNSDDEDNCHFLSDEELEFENGDERIQNDLLNEICTDIGIKDSMDLDFYDMASDSVIQFDDQLTTGIVAGTSETPSNLQDLFNMQNWTPVTGRGSGGVQSNTPAGQGQVPFMQPSQFSQRQQLVSKGQGHNVHQGHTVQHGPSQSVPPMTSQGHVSMTSQGSFQPSPRHLSQVQMSQVSSSQSPPVASQFSQDRNGQYQGQGQRTMHNSRGQGHRGYMNPQYHNFYSQGQLGTGLNTPDSNLGNQNCDKSMTVSKRPTNQQPSIVLSDMDDAPGAGFFTESQQQIKKEPKSFNVHTSHSLLPARPDAGFSKAAEGHESSNQHSTLSTPKVRSPISLSTSPFSFSPNDKAVGDIFSHGNQASQFDMSLYCDNILEKVGDSPSETLAATNNLCSQFDKSGTSSQNSSSFVNSMANQRDIQDTVGQKMRNNLSNGSGSSVGSRRGTFSPLSCDNSNLSSPAQSRQASPTNHPDLTSDFPGYETNPNSAMPSRMPSPSGYDPSPFVSRWTSPTTAASSPTKDLDNSGSQDLDIKDEPIESQGQMHCGSPSVSSTFPESPLPGFQGNTTLPGYRSNQRQTVCFQGDSQKSSSSSDALLKKVVFNQDQNLYSAPLTPNSVRFSGTLQFDSDDRKPQLNQLNKVANSDFPNSPKHEPKSPCPSYPSSPTVPISQSQRIMVCDTTTGSPKPNLQNPIDVHNRSDSVFKVPNVPVMEMSQDKSRPGSALSLASDISMCGMSGSNSLACRPSGPGPGRRVIDLTCDTECPDPTQWELKSPHDAGYHSGDLASNASRSTMPTPVPSIHGSMDNISTKSALPAMSFSQLLQKKLNKVDGYNRYPFTSTVTTSSGGQVFKASTPTVTPKFRDKPPMPNVQHDQNAQSNFRNYPNMKNWNKGANVPPSVNDQNEHSAQGQPNAAYPDDYFRRNSRKTAAHFASGNSSVETSPTRHMPRKQMCVNPTYGQYSRDRSPISKARTPLTFDSDGNQSQVARPATQNNLTGNQNGTLSRSGSYTNLASPGSKFHGITPLAEFVQRQLPPTDNARKSKSIVVVSSSPSTQVQSLSQNHNNSRMFSPNNSVPVIPQSCQNGQFPPCAQSPSSFNNMANVSGIPDESFNVPPQMQNYAQPGNMQMMCSTPQNNGNIRMTQMNKKWQQSQGMGYHPRQVPYPQALGVRQSLHQTQPQNFEFGQNSMQGSQSCRFASRDGQDGQNIVTPSTTPNFHSNNQTQRQLLQSGGYVQHCDGHMNAQNTGYLNTQSVGQMNNQNGAHFNRTQEYFSDSGPPTNLDLSTPGPPTNFGTAEEVPMMSPGHVLGPSQAQHWLVQKYKQRAINSQMENSGYSMSGQLPQPDGQSSHSFTQIKPRDHFSSQSEHQQYQAGNSRNLKTNGQNKSCLVAPNVCIDKNSNFTPINHRQNGMEQSTNKFNNFRQPQIPGFQMKKEHVSFDDNPMYSNESFGSMVTNVSNTTARPTQHFDGSLLMNATQDTCHNSTVPSPSPFHDNLGHSAADLNTNSPFSPPDPNNISDDQLTSIVIGSQGHSQTPWQPENTQTIPGQTNVPQKTLSSAAHDAKQGFIRNLVCDKSKAFRSHPLFPLLRDLIIADMNFNSPTFPFRLIANLPTDFNKLLHNYLQRNRTNSSQDRNAAVEGVIMDALKYAHQSLIEKIATKKKELGEDIKEQKATSVIEEFCAKFDQAVRNSFQMPDGQSTSQYQGQGHLGPPGDLDMNSDTGSLRGGIQAKKHPVLPKEAVASMMAWLREHRNNPYPNEEEKEQLLQDTKISTNQLNYWFTNARRRILPKWAAQEANQFHHEVSSTS